MDLVLSNLQWLMYHKTKSHRTKSTSSWFFASMQSSKLANSFPSFLETLNLPVSSLRCKTLWIVNFLFFFFFFFLFICLTSSLVHFREGWENLTWGTGQVFISLSRFLLQSLVLRSVLILLRYFIFTFTFISLCLMLSAFLNSHVFIVF